MLDRCAIRRRNKIAFFEVQGVAPPDCKLCGRFGVTKVPTVVGLIPDRDDFQTMPEGADMIKW